MFHYKRTKRESMILGLTTLVGLLIGLLVKNILVWTLVGLAVGYVITFYIPLWFNQRNHKIRK